jgi:hypothetical protein
MATLSYGAKCILYENNLDIESINGNINEKSFFINRNAANRFHYNKNKKSNDDNDNLYSFAKLFLYRKFSDKIISEQYLRLVVLIMSEVESNDEKSIEKIQPFLLAQKIIYYYPLSLLFDHGQLIITVNNTQMSILPLVIIKIYDISQKAKAIRKTLKSICNKKQIVTIGTPLTMLYYKKGTYVGFEFYEYDKYRDVILDDIYTFELYNMQMIAKAMNQHNKNQGLCRLR